MAPEVLGLRALNRATLARQLLLERHEIGALRALQRLAGLQAQAPAPPYVGLWTRLRAFDPAELSDAIAGRGVVRVSLMRGTIHAATADDARRLRPLLAPLYERWVRGAHPRLGGADPDAVAAAAREELEAGEPLTAARLRERLGGRWPHADPAALTTVARCALTLVQTPPRGLWGRSGAAAHTTLEAWVGAPLDERGTPEELVRRYLAAFGPASVRDLQTWCGLTGLGPVVDGLRGELAVFAGEDGRELFDLPDAPRPDPGTRAPVRFLPEWDNLLRSHADRRRFLTDEHREALRRPNDVVPGTVLVDGFVAATWRVERRAGGAALDVQPLRRLSERHRAAVAAEGRRLTRWLDAYTQTA